MTDISRMILYAGLDVITARDYDAEAIRKMAEIYAEIDPSLQQDVFLWGTTVQAAWSKNQRAIAEGLALLKKLSDPPPPQTGEWQVQIGPGGEEQYKEKDDVNWTNADSLGAIYNVLGGDHFSTASKNRPLLMNPGETMEIMPGAYMHFRLTRSYGPSDAPLVLKAVVPGTVSIKNNPVGGSQTHYIEWGGPCERYDIDFIGDDQRAIGTENPSSDRWGGNHPGFLQQRFYNCNVIGGYNAETDTGPSNKWGVLCYEIGRSNDGNPGFIWSGGSVTGIKQEHAFYQHNTIGDSIYENMSIKWCGRSGFQFTARPSEGPDGTGNITIRNVTGEDCCFEGPHFINFKGNHDGDCLVENVRYTAGRNANLHPSNQGQVTGFIVVHDGNNGQPTRKVTVKDCTTDLVDPDRPAIDVSTCTTFELINTTVLVDQPHKIGLQIAKGSVPNITIDRQCNIQGKTVYGGNTYQTWADFLTFAQTDPQITLIN